MSDAGSAPISPKTLLCMHHAVTCFVGHVLTRSLNAQFVIAIGLSWLLAPKMVLSFCDQVLVRCDSCKKEMHRSEFKNGHWENCPIACPLGCGMWVTRKTLVDHCRSGKCSYYEMTCPASASSLGCKWHGHGGEEYANHTANCPLVKLIPYAECDRREISELKKTVMELKRTIAEQTAASEKEKEQMQKTIMELKAMISEQASFSKQVHDEMRRSALELKSLFSEKRPLDQTQNDNGIVAEIGKTAQQLKDSISEQAAASKRTRDELLEMSKSILELKRMVLQQTASSKATQSEVVRIPERTVALEQKLVAQMSNARGTQNVCLSPAHTSNKRERYGREENDCTMKGAVEDSPRIPPMKKEKADDDDDFDSPLLFPSVSRGHIIIK